MIPVKPRVLAAITALGVFAAAATPSLAAVTVGNAAGPGNGNCLAQPKESTGSNPGSPVVITADPGNEITEIAIKSGNTTILDPGECVFVTETGNPADVQTFFSPPGQPCYTITGLGSGTVTVTKFTTNPANECQNISHIEWRETPIVITQTSTTTTTTTTTTNPTPELDSVALFAAGGLALAGYALYQRRRAKRQP
jgi:hypothetical protein